MELNAIYGLRLVGDSSVFGILGCANDVESFRQITKLVTMRHPHGHSLLEAFEKPVHMTTDSARLQIGMSIFSGSPGNDVIRVQAVRDLLKSVADTQDRDTEIEDGRVNVGCILLVHGVGTAGEDNTLGLPP